MTKNTKQRTEKAREGLELEQFTNNNTSYDDSVAAWRKWRDILTSLLYATPERSAELVKEGRAILDRLNEEHRAEISPLLDEIEKESVQELKHEQKQIKKTFTFVNVKSAEVPHEIKRALLNKNALFNECGIVGNQHIFIKKLQDNKPSSLKQFDDNMRECQKNGGRWFYIINIDNETAKSRGAWFGKNNILCDISNGKVEELQKEYFDSERNYYSRRRANVRGLDSFWRKSDCEEARKCAKAIFCIYQPSGDIHRIKDLQKVRKEERENLKKIDYYRHDTSKAQFDEKTHTFKEDKRGYYYYTVDRFDVFDVCGWNLSNKRAELKQKARELKEQRDKARLIETRCEKEIAQLNKLTFELVASLDQLTTMLKNYLINNKKLRLFWLQSRIERTTDRIADICELKKDFENKNEIFSSVSQMMERYNKRTTNARHTLQLNAIYLSMTEEEHADTESAKNNAIYYGYYNEVNGALILDIEKAQAEKVKRGY